MKLVDEAALDRFRGPGLCDWCRKPVRSRDAHHVMTKGAGRVDHPWNTAALCTTFSGGDNCHATFHDGNILRADLMAVVAKREGVLQDDIEGLVYLIRRLPKGGDHEACIRDFQVMARNRRSGLQGEAGKDGVRRPLPRIRPGDRLPGVEAYEGWTPF
jgi:hypothetical protein